jgi:hypothetical protein
MEFSLIPLITLYRAVPVSPALSRQTVGIDRQAADGTRRKVSFVTLGEHVRGELAGRKRIPRLPQKTKARVGGPLKFWCRK